MCVCVCVCVGVCVGVGVGGWVNVWVCMHGHKVYNKSKGKKNR